MIMIMCTLTCYSDLKIFLINANKSFNVLVYPVRFFFWGVGGGGNDVPAAVKLKWCIKITSLFLDSFFSSFDSFELSVRRYPNATAEELASGDNVCIICREEMTTSCKKLPCNHIFHTSCLRSWFQRQQTCPTCRLDVLRMPRPTQTPVAEAANANAQVNNGLQQQQQFFQNREFGLISCVGPYGLSNAGGAACVH